MLPLYKQKRAKSFSINPYTHVSLICCLHGDVWENKIRNQVKQAFFCINHKRALHLKGGNQELQHSFNVYYMAVLWYSHMNMNK